MLKGYRGFLRELARTGSWRALALQVRTGARHFVRRLARRGGDDPIARFLANYGADGFRLPDPAWMRLQHAAEACLACGLCTVECARIGAEPGTEPRDAVLSAARLEIDWLRLGLPATASAPEAAGRAREASGSGETICAGCRACEAVCPTGIPIAAVQEARARLAPGS